MAERRSEHAGQPPDTIDEARAVEPGDLSPGADPGDAYHRARRAGEVDDERPRAGDEPSRGPGIEDVFRSGS